MIGARQNPFSLYDFLGYFTPGALFLYEIAAALLHFKGGIGLEGILSKFNFEKVEIYIPFILLAYVVGHFLSFVSAITVERYSIWSNGYPSRFLLKLSIEKYWGVSHIRERLVRFFVGCLLFPVPILDAIFGRGLYLRAQFTKSLDDILSKIIKNKIVSLMKNKGKEENYDLKTLEENHDFFRYAYHYVVENSPTHLPKMQNYVALYGFLRTLTLIFIISSWALLVHVAYGIYVKLFECQEVNIMWETLSVFMILSYMGYMGFMKFYRRFSLEALMALSVRDISEESEKV